MSDAIDSVFTDEPSNLASLWLCLRFSSLSLNSLGLLWNSESVSAITYQQQIWQLNQAAYELGVRRGHSVSHALMLLPDIKLLERSFYHENQALERLSDWAYKFTPHVHVYDDHTLLLEIGRSLTLFKGLKHIQHLIKHDLITANFDCDYGLAYTPKSSHLLTFLSDFEWGEQSVESKIKARIANSSLQHLAVEPKLIAKLQHCGFERLADIENIPRSELGERFGREFIDYLDRLYGAIADPQLFKVPDEVFRSRIDFAEPISNKLWIEQQLERLLSDLVEFLQSRNLVCRMFTWCFYNEKNHLLHSLNVSLASMKMDFNTFKELTDLQLENTVMQWEFSGIELSSHSLQQKQAVDADLFNSAADQEDVNELLEKLINRLGEKSLFKVTSVPEHLPELACQKTSVRHCGTQPELQIHELDTDKLEVDRALHDEPLRLLDKAKRLIQRDGKPMYRGELQLIHGPHRISSHWWARLQSRDYYIAKQADGSLIWLYFERSSREWYLHGVFA